MSVKDLTPGERLTIARRRSGLSQRDAATGYGISLSTYRRYEADEYDTTSVPYCPLVSMSVAEACFIARRRQNLTQDDVAKRIDRSRWFVNMVEMGHLDTSLVANCLGIKVA